ncbi:MAG: amidohydrolase family protein [Halanaerobiaceae bacterium]
MSILLKDCLLRSEDYMVKDLEIEKGKIVNIDENIEGNFEQIYDIREKLVMPSFIEPHIHLDKIFIDDEVRANDSGTLFEAIEIIWEKKKNYTVEEVAKRAERAIKLAVKNGITRMRTHVDVDTIGGLTPLKGVLEARNKYKDLIDIEIIAFPQEGIIQDPGTEDLIWEAMSAGADLVGGMPANEKDPEDSMKHIEIAFNIAREHNADIDMHIDETDDPFYRTLEMLADKTIENGWKKRVTAGHTCALAAYDDHYAQYVMDKVKEAKVNIITNPATNLMLQGREDNEPKRRGITRVKELLEREINVSYGQDCVKDTFYPYGQVDPLEVGLITAHAAQMTLPQEIEIVMDMQTYNAAKILRLEDYGIEVGNRADLVVLDAKSAREAIRRQPDRLYVFREGNLIAQTSSNSEIFFEEDGIDDKN